MENLGVKKTNEEQEQPLQQPITEEQQQPITKTVAISLTLVPDGTERLTLNISAGMTQFELLGLFSFYADKMKSDIDFAFFQGKPQQSLAIPEAEVVN